MQESGNTTTAHSLARFLESFFRERNIKWMLLTGVLILVGSSLMLVTRHWEEIGPAWKSLAILGYTAAAFAGGRLAYFRLGLRTTGTVLLALVVLLIPIDFLALHWLERGAVLAILFLANLAFAWAAARSVFDHFLHGRQPTFLASYITLAAAGAAAPIVHGALAPWAALALWAVFAAGAVKVNRHVFWLAEERKLPRIFGFFPIALLGAQFLALYLLHFRERIEPQWVGLGCALVAVPVLLTADAVARVFESRTGGIVRPLPPSVLFPLGTGILLATAGLCLASVNLFSPERDALALVPAAAIVAFLMACIARRTSRSAFVWAMLAAITIAYNFSPVFFRDLAGRVVSWGAAAVQEERLPYAFYGLTYLPLLLAAGMAADRLARRGDGLFRGPIQAYSVGLACLFLAASTTHEMTLLPVAGAIAGFLAWRAWRLREAATTHVALVLLAILAYVAALAGVETFVERAAGLRAPRGATLLVEAIGILPLLVLRRPLYRTAGAALALVLAVAWLATFAGGPGGFFVSSAVAISVLLAICALERVMPLAGEAAVLFSLVALLLRRAHGGASGLELLHAGTLLACGVWVLSALLKDGQSRLARAFQGPSLRVSAALLAVSVGLHLPLLALEIAGTGALESIGESPLGIAASVALTLWAFDAARRFARPDLFYYPAALCALGAAGVAARAYGPLGGLDGVALVWAAGGLVALAAVHRSTLGHGRLLVSGAEPRVVALSGERQRHATRILGALFLGVSVLSLTSIAWPMRAAGGMAAAGLLGVTALSAPALRRLVWIPASWQLVLLAVRLFTPEVESIPGFLAAALPAALASSACLVAFHALHAAEAGPGGVLFIVQRFLLRTLAVATLAASALGHSLGPIEGIAAAASFGLLVASEVISASRYGDARRAWSAEVIAAAALLYFVRFGWISFGHGVSTYVLVGSGFLLHGLGRLVARRPSTLVLAGPFRKTAAWLPLAAVLSAVWRAIAGVPGPWLGSRSLALFLAAGFYFWRGLEEKRKGLVVLAAGIANIALALLWHELRWTDPQFFLVPLGASVLALVELLREEIPKRWRDPLRYAGALVILVSPVFHIVEGSWLHMLTLMVGAVGIILVAIGLRVRAVLYTGTAFLVADLAAMVIRGSIENSNVLWIAGLSLGALIIGLAAVCENRRETVLAKARLAAAVLEKWD